MTTLVTRVRAHCTGQATSGQNTLKLTLECIQHMRDNQNEWSALAYLIALAQPAQSRIVRKIAGQALQGWKIAKDVKQPSGLRFTKVKGHNQGFDDWVLTQLLNFIEQGKSIQSQDVVKAFTPESAAPGKSHDELVQAMAKNIKARMERDNITWEEIVSKMVGVTEPDF